MGDRAGQTRPLAVRAERRAVGYADDILNKAGGQQLAGEALEVLDYNSLFYRSPGSVAAAKFSLAPP